MGIEPDTVVSFMAHLSTRWFKYDREWFMCKQVSVCPGHIWTTLYISICVS
jgi:hypothetical protein